VLGNAVRLPPVNAGEATIVGRYGLERARAVILHPADYAALREAATVLGELEDLEHSASDAAVEAHEVEDRPNDDRLVEDSATIAELLGL
jgi:hypothetical protein